MKNRTEIIKKILAVAGAAVFTVAVFFAGYFTRKITQPSYVSVYEWAIKTIKQNYFYDFDEKQCEGLSLKEIGAKLDRYSAFYTADEYKAVISENAGAKSGLGITYNFIPDVGAKIVSVLGNSPAYLGGIRAGDTITEGSFTDNGANISVKFEAAQQFSDFIDARATGEEFTLTAKAENGREAESFTVSKEFYTASYTFFATNKTAWEVRYTENSNQPSFRLSLEDAISYLPDGFGYIRLNQFYGNAAAEFGELIKMNSGDFTSLIIDLRNNGGGYVSVMQDIAGYFAAAGTSAAGVAMTARYKNGREEKYSCVKHTDGLVPAGTQIYVLANSGTASASEALIGVLVSIGALKYENIFLSDFSEEYLSFAGESAKTAQSYGKGIMQTTFTKPVTREALKLTTAQIYWPNGKCIHDVGLTVADGCRLAKAEWTATKGDTELEKICTDYLS